MARFTCVKGEAQFGSRTYGGQRLVRIDVTEGEELTPAEAAVLLLDDIKALLVARFTD